MINALRWADIIPSSLLLRIQAVCLMTSRQNGLERDPSRANRKLSISSLWKVHNMQGGYIQNPSSLLSVRSHHSHHKQETFRTPIRSLLILPAQLLETNTLLRGLILRRELLLLTIRILKDRLNTRASRLSHKLFTSSHRHGNKANTVYPR